ncbi:MAG: hypothetical protein ACPG80_05530, partial [Rickettsiales bacterium]
EKILKRCEPDEPADKAYHNQVKRQLMRSALVHDMGELEGELSVASARKDFSAEKLKAFEQWRGEAETAVFRNAITARGKALMEQGWPAAEVQQKCQNYLSDYHRVEAEEDFFAKAHKTVERMQSQQDYMRFEGEGAAPLLHTVIPEEGCHKEFMVSYVGQALDGVVNGEKVSSSIRELANQQSHPVIIAMAEAITQYARQQRKRIEEKVRYEPKPFAQRILEQRRNITQSQGLGA